MKYYLILSLIFFTTCFVHGQEILPVPAGKAITVDGKEEAQEWQEAYRFVVKLSYGDINVLVKRDNKNLYLGFLGFTSDMGLVPEVFIDTTDYEKDVWENGMAFSDKQWWFHVSGSDCWSRGRYNAYDTCEKEHDSFEANNFENMERPPDIVEMRIPFDTIGGEISGVTGIAFAFTDARKRWIVWPEHAQLAVPRTWAWLRFQQD